MRFRVGPKGWPCNQPVGPGPFPPVVSRLIEPHTVVDTSQAEWAWIMMVPPDAVPMDDECHRHMLHVLGYPAHEIQRR
jgi:hypothetical protein